MFEDCAARREPCSAREGEGYRIALANLEGGRIGIAAQAVGMARAAFEAALAYAKERESVRQADHRAPGGGFRLADMATQIEVARQMVLHAAAPARRRRSPASRKRRWPSCSPREMAERVCSDAIQIHGGYGYLDDFPVERIYRDVRVCQIYEGTSDIQRLVIARAIASEGP